MKIAIVFHEGTCGRFLANFLLNDSLPEPNYRIMDNMDHVCFHSGRHVARINGSRHIITIRPDREDLELFFTLLFSKFDELAVPVTGHSQRFSQRVDWYINNMIHYHQKLNELEKYRTDTMLTLREVLDIDRCKELYIQMNGSVPDDQRLQWAQTYMQKQVVDRNKQDLCTAFRIFSYELDNGLLDKKRIWPLQKLTTENVYKLDQCLDLRWYS